MRKPITIFFDGASKGNPGPSGIGFLLLEEPHRKHEFHQSIGIATNNQAEYTALREALREAKKIGATHVQVFSDSELVVRQLNGEYRIKDAVLKSLHEEISAMREAFQQIHFTHIPREKNKEADALANRGVNGTASQSGKSVTTRSFFDFCKPAISREQAKVLVLGLPYEGTVNSRPGTVAGPDAIRSASRVVESYSPFLKRDLCEIPFFDDGNVLAPGKGKQAYDAMAEEIERRLNGLAAHPVFLGGDHSVTYPIVKALHGMGKKFSMVHLDAHPDFQNSFEGDPWCYATVMRRSKELTNMEIFQLGIRTATREELDDAVKSNHLFLMDRFDEGLAFVQEKTRGKNIYVSLDIDAIDPSLAPGTSNPEYGGLRSEQIRRLISALKEAKVIGFDIVEVAPNLDPSGFTPILAAEIARDAILSWWK